MPCIDETVRREFRLCVDGDEVTDFDAECRDTVAVERQRTALEKLLRGNDGDRARGFQNGNVRLGGPKSRQFTGDNHGLQRWLAVGERGRRGE